MKYRSILLTLLLVAIAWQISAQEPAGWLRYPAVSPDGQQIAFNYKGNIYLSPISGGTARPLTISSSYDFHPVWSPDGSQIAFASDRHGNFDVFIINAAGGKAKRLTYHSANDLPNSFSPDGKSIYFLSGRMMNHENSQFPYGRFNQLYKLSIEGDLPQLTLPIPMEQVNIDDSGNRWLYMDLKGYEDSWRKHHTSSIARDIWLYDRQSNRHKQLTTYAGEDRNAIWAPDQKHIYYLSEKSGTFNVWKLNPETPEASTQITTMDKHPVRFLSIAKNGTMVFSYHGELYSLKEGQEPSGIDIIIPYDQEETTQLEKMSNGASEMAISPDGKEIAFVIRGEIFVTGVESGMTKRITNSPEQERNVSFSPDGKKLLYAAERNGSWNLYETRKVKTDEPYFYAATLLKEEVLLASEKETFQPKYSPDGKEVAFLEERTTLRVINLNSKQSRTVLPGDKNYSYSDGDQHYEWSPDSKWFLVTFIEKNRWVSEVGLVKADGKQPVINLTQSGYAEGKPTWALDGKAVIYASDKEGFRSHGSWGSQNDVYAMFFTKEAYDRFTLSKDELEILKEKEKDNSKDEKAEESNKKSKKSGTKEAESDKSLEIDWTNLEDRKTKLTLSSAILADMVIHPEGEKLYYLSSRDNSYDLWELNIREKSTKTLSNFKGGGASLKIDEKGENLFVLAGGNMSKVKTADGSVKGVSYTAEMYLDKVGERDYFFEHMWRQVDKKFYVEDLHGVDWKGLKKEYSKFLPHINNNRDFAEMMSELLGELNGSHTGCRYNHNDPKGDQTAALGIFTDHKHTGAGLRIAEILDKSPLTIADAGVKNGDIIEKIDGEPIAAGQNFFPLLNHKAGKNVVLSILSPQDNKRKDVTVKAISIGSQNNLLYERWVKTRRAETERLSDGRIGYVHVRGMNSPSFREVFSELLGRYADKEAVIVDTRFNGGGWLHDDLATLLSGEQYVSLVPRGQHIGSEPQNKWQRPSIVLAGEGNYSDAHFFPVAYRALGIGEIVGMPIPGTTTAVWWEQQIDNSLVFGIPQVGVTDMKGNYLENQQLEPDHLVKNMPDELIKGKDSQLEKAVELMLNAIGE